MSWEIAIVLSFIGVIAFFSFYVKTLDDSFFPLKFLYFFMSAFFLILLLVVTKRLAEFNSASSNIITLFDTGYKLLIVVFSILIIYTGIYYIKWFFTETGNSLNLKGVEVERKKVRIFK